ncbi:Hypothetical protein PYTT_1496 [Akkermansia glycaniphila]|uniref:Uncharacterized protein n=1 Tax=Akkermansia glycaniphila TaxID=1679444 RepID=A0A1H6LKZ4_9BACT|nr:Hypothetical protein PYTT_1496 [Akkermansia glycaniphila]
MGAYIDSPKTVAFHAYMKRHAVLQCRHRFPTDCMEQRITCWPLKNPSFPSS